MALFHQGGQVAVATIPGMILLVREQQQLVVKPMSMMPMEIYTRMASWWVIIIMAGYMISTGIRLVIIMMVEVLL